MARLVNMKRLLTKAQNIYIQVFKAAVKKQFRENSKRIKNDLCRYALAFQNTYAKFNTDSKN